MEKLSRCALLALAAASIASCSGPDLPARVKQAAVASEVVVVRTDSGGYIAFNGNCADVQGSDTFTLRRNAQYILGTFPDSPPRTRDAQDEFEVARLMLQFDGMAAMITVGYNSNQNLTGLTITRGVAGDRGHPTTVAALITTEYASKSWAQTCHPLKGPEELDNTVPE